MTLRQRRRSGLPVDGLGCAASGVVSSVADGCDESRPGRVGDEQRHQQLGQRFDGVALLVAGEVDEGRRTEVDGGTL